MEKPRFFDSHTHLNSPAFAEDLEVVWRESRSAGVRQAVVVGYDLESSAAAIDLARKYEGLWAGVGVSPHDCPLAPQSYLNDLRRLAKDSCVRAIGEIGLEYHHPVGHHAEQKRIFRDQLQLAVDLGLPAIIHSRDSDQDLLEVLRQVRPARAVLHCYTGGLETLKTAVSLGLYISFSGIVTFPKVSYLQTCVQSTPDDRLLIETDCPYLAPVPHRGKRCVPSYLVHTAHHVSQLRGMTVSALAELTCSNAKRLFAKP